MKYLFVLLLFLTITKVTIAQIGIPQINNYTNIDYKGGTQNWGIDQDKNGIMYFANNEGLLTFNGKYWKLYPLPHKTIVRAVKVASNGRIYVGGQDEIGYFFPNSNGVLKYHSILDLIPLNERRFADVWDIEILENDLFFRTTSKIFQFKDDAFRVYKSKGTWEFLGEANHQVFAQDTSKGLLTLRNGIWVMLSSVPELKNSLITSVINFNKDTLLITTLKNGLYLMNDSKIVKKIGIDDASFFKHRIYKAINVNKMWNAFATISAGCFITDKSGKIIQQFSFADGLQKNNIRSIFKDRNQNLWLGLDNGIDFIAFNNAVKYIYPDKAKQSSGYSTKILNQKLYIGTSNGLFYSLIKPGLKDISYSTDAFTEVNNTRGQVWNLNVINNTLLIAHEDGAFVVNNGNANRLFPYPGTWLFETLSPYYPAKDIVAGTYTGLHRIGFENGKFIDKGNISGNKESLRFILFENNTNTIWASHPYRGIYRFKLSDDKKSIAKTWLYQKKDGLPSSLNNYISIIKNRIVVATEKGIYEFDEAKQASLQESNLPYLTSSSSIMELQADELTFD